MAQIDVSPTERAFIEERIRRFDVEAPEERRWLSTYVSEHRALPLYLGLTETIGIRANGALISWSTEGEWTGTRELDEDTWVNTALVRGAEQYRELRGLIPERPATAATCSDCGGTGRPRGVPSDLRNISCACGGVGWIRAGAA